jgi:hypothetical protein
VNYAGCDQTQLDQNIDSVVDLELSQQRRTHISLKQGIAPLKAAILLSQKHHKRT